MVVEAAAVSGRTEKHSRHGGFDETCIDEGTQSRGHHSMKLCHGRLGKWMRTMCTNADNGLILPALLGKFLEVSARAARAPLG
jgi:hypothetical protein